MGLGNPMAIRVGAVNTPIAETIKVNRRCPRCFLCSPLPRDFVCCVDHCPRQFARLDVRDVIANGLKPWMNLKK
jgi:hypothetical protein